MTSLHNRPPDGVANPRWVDDAIAARPELLTGAARPHDAEDARRARRERLDGALAVKLLGSHLHSRAAQMTARPTDLSGLDPAEATLLVRAMAAAGHADGSLALAERRRIVRLATTGIPDAEARQTLLAEIDTPHSIESLIRLVETPAVAERFYAVSARVARRTSATNRAFLGYLASRLAIDADFVLRIDREVDEADARVTRENG